MLYSTSRVYTQSSLTLVFFHTMNLRRCTLPLAGLQFTTGEAACWHWHTAMLTNNKNVLDRTQWVNNGLVKRSSTWYSARSRHGHHRGTQVHGAHQAASHVPALYLPSYSRYSFTDPERMEGWARPRVQRATGPRLLHESPQPADSNPRPRGRWSSALTTRPLHHPICHSMLVVEFIAQLWSVIPAKLCSSRWNNLSVK